MGVPDCVPDCARTLLDAMETRAAAGYVPAVSRAAVHNALGDRERALELLEQAVGERDLRLTFLNVEPRWDNLRDDARFIAVIDQVGLENRLRTPAASNNVGGRE